MSELAGWRHVYSGKVRDLYEPVAAEPGASEELLVVASDRVSAFDHVLEPAIPGKGELLTRLSLWWFATLGLPNHLLPDQSGLPPEVAGRAMLVRRLRMHPIECVVRGYLAGSGWAEYREHGTVCGIALPTGLHSGDRLPEPIYTPAWKAPMGEHDQNISFARTMELVGPETAAELRDTSLRVYADAAAIAESRGVLLADTKFEFGVDPATGRSVLADEVLTSDSSRYWDAAAWRAGSGDGTRTNGVGAQARMVSFDKQIVRDWLAAQWDRRGTPPRLPAEIVERTAARYAELVERLTGSGIPE